MSSKSAEEAIMDHIRKFKKRFLRERMIVQDENLGRYIREEGDSV